MSDFTCFLVLVGVLVGYWEWCVMDAAQKEDEAARREILAASIKHGINYFKHGRMSL